MVEEIEDKEESLLTSPGVEDPRSPGFLGGVGRNWVICDPATVGTASAGILLAGNLDHQWYIKISDLSLELLQWCICSMHDEYEKCNFTFLKSFATSSTIL